jgi:hypothetical protein
VAQACPGRCAVQPICRIFPVPESRMHAWLQQQHDKMEEGNKRGRKRGSIHIWASSDTREVCVHSFSRNSLRRLTAQSALCSRISSASFCVYFFPPLPSTAKPPPCESTRQNHASFRRVPPFALPSHAPPTHFTLTKIETRIHATHCRRKQTISPGSQSEIGQGLKASSSPCPRQSWPLPRPFVEAQ